MTYKEKRIGYHPDYGWYFNLYYKDFMGFEVRINGDHYRSAHQAKIWATKKAKEIDSNGKILS